MPALWLPLDPEDLRDLDAQVALVRPPARLTRGTLAAQLVRQALAARRRARAAVLAEQLLGHPRRPGAGLPIPLQDQALDLITAGEAWLLSHFIRAGEWEGQIRALARRWRQDGLTEEELCAAGMTGLLRAIKGRKPGLGFRSYAYQWIKKELGRLCRASGSIVMETEEEMRIRHAVEKRARRGLDAAGIAKETGLSLAQVARGLQGRRPLGWKGLDDR